MEVYGAFALASISSISPSLHSSHQPTSVCGFRRVRVWCVKTDVNGSSQSLKILLGIETLSCAMYGVDFDNVIDDDDDEEQDPGSGEIDGEEKGPNRLANEEDDESHSQMKKQDKEENTF
ncbi:hypothetical protein Ccrd_026758 [Cynara cardunculus var. scolymus]|uniref:Uncharacterized protein n=1 Tax=Cynara cardunculus var. scolymus TaxID=59895 RepID=A0A103XCW3_CYNCS|nr:hypothetical protein Ccrd_026758 [Cynara cardunculus var. scolymus]